MICPRDVLFGEISKHTNHIRILNYIVCQITIKYGKVVSYGIEMQV